MQTINRPELTFPANVANFVTEAYSDAACILEYGSGGSTVLASEMAGKKIYSVESDNVWAENLTAYISASPETKSKPQVMYVDIGPTKEWGHPADDSAWRRYFRYPLSVWDKPGFKDPDVVLIDGRFRVACFYATLLRATKDVTILFDDYTERKNYWCVEDFLKPTETVERMAVFKVSKNEDIPREKLTQIVGAFFSPA